ncbi:NADH-quinone oxidoreductase subunit J family protein [Tundrisphaera sp. TA3]|uniref:NADH-quinone oxidoreductase subunit J family protein n=1 Tax=Tundrisphaera sp. TA3 TaxID=3435775 RepID=UPI003EB724EB
MDTLSQFDQIRAFAVILLGATGAFLLLPHRHGLARPRVAHLLGFALSGLSVILLASFWRPSGHFVGTGFFYAFAISAVMCGILTVTSRDPIHSALWFAGVVLATSGLFLLSGAQFLAAGTVIVYAGAIIVTFLFVIMLAQMEGRAVYDRMARSPFLATLTSYLLFFGLLYALLTVQRPAGQQRVQTGVMVETRQPSLIRASQRQAVGEYSRTTDRQKLVLAKALPPTSQLPEATPGRPSAGNHVAGLGGSLFTEHLVTVELAGALLFVALIGCVAITRPRTPIRPPGYTTLA